LWSIKYEIQKLNKKIKIVSLYLGSILLIVSYWKIHNSEYLNHLIEISNKNPDPDGFGIFLTIGLIKYFLLLCGLLIPIILTFQLIKNRINDNSTT
jgi:hypothetical protein